MSHKPFYGHRVEFEKGNAYTGDKIHFKEVVSVCGYFMQDFKKHENLENRMSVKT